MESVKSNLQGQIPMTEEEFASFRDLIRKEFGIIMKGDKRLTLHAKLSHRLTILGLTSYREYYEVIVSDPSREELFHVISHITNNETYFQREITRLTMFAGLLSDIKRSKQKENKNSVRFLSAGCSSGEEVYTLSIMLMESGLFAWGWEVNVIGIDVNRNVLKRARNAEYTRNSFRMLNGNEEFLQKYFDRNGELYVLKKPYRSHAEFRHGNILQPSSFEGIDSVDAIFCRNVFIYMSDNAIERITENFYQHLSQDGYLFIGSSESLVNKTELFVPEYREGIIVYKKNPSLSS